MTMFLTVLAYFDSSLLKFNDFSDILRSADKINTLNDNLSLDAILALELSIVFLKYFVILVRAFTLSH